MCQVATIFVTMARENSFWDSKFGGFLNNLLFGLPGILYSEYKSSKLTGAEREQNAFNAQQAELQRSFEAEQAGVAMQFSADQAERQMAFQERMSNTQYQRGVVDMQKAGLNPALAYGNGGAVAPSGAAGSAAMPAGAAASGSGRGIPFTMSDVMASLKMRKEMKLLDAQAENVKADTAATEANTAATLLANEWNPFLWSGQVEINSKTVERINAEVKSLLASAEGQRLANEWNPMLWQNELDNGRVNRDSTLVGIAKVQQEIQNLVAQEQLTYSDRDLKLLMQALTSAQTVLVNSQATEVTERAWYEDWKNDFRSEHGIDPDAGLWQLVSQIIGSKVNSLRDTIKNWHKNH